jgi:hypothetical protein
MATSESNNDSLILAMLKTPVGQEILGSFITTLSRTLDLGRSLAAAEETTNRNQVPIPLIQLAAVIDFLRIFGPLILNALKSQRQ